VFSQFQVVKRGGYNAPLMTTVPNDVLQEICATDTVLDAEGNTDRVHSGVRCPVVVRIPAAGRAGLRHDLIHLVTFR